MKFKNHQIIGDKKIIDNGVTHVEYIKVHQQFLPSFFHLYLIGNDGKSQFNVYLFEYCDHPVKSPDDYIYPSKITSIRADEKAMRCITIHETQPACDNDLKVPAKVLSKRVQNFLTREDTNPF